MAQLDILKMLITGTDLDRYLGNEDLLNYALSYASSEILKRRNTNTLEEQYWVNQVQGAIYYLSKIGAESTKSVGENGVTTTWNTVPDFLQSIIPKLGVIKS